MHNVNYTNLAYNENANDTLKNMVNILGYNGGGTDMTSLGHISGIEYTTNADGTTGLKVDVQANDIVYKPTYRFMPAYDRGRWMPTMRKVIFNDPATIVLWNDGTKTVVKAHNEKYDPEKGLAMAIAEKYYGNYSKFKKDIPTENLEKD